MKLSRDSSVCSSWEVLGAGDLEGQGLADVAAASRCSPESRLKDTKMNFTIVSPLTGKKTRLSSPPLRLGGEVEFPSLCPQRVIGQEGLRRETAPATAASAALLWAVSAAFVSPCSISDARLTEPIVPCFGHRVTHISDADDTPTPGGGASGVRYPPRDGSGVGLRTQTVPHVRQQLYDTVEGRRRLGAQILISFQTLSFSFALVFVSGFHLMWASQTTECRSEALLWCCLQGCTDTDAGVPPPLELLPAV